jgi:hypothetical protein
MLRSRTMVLGMLGLVSAARGVAASEEFIYGGYPISGGSALFYPSPAGHSMEAAGTHTVVGTSLYPGTIMVQREVVLPGTGAMWIPWRTGNFDGKNPCTLKMTVGAGWKLRYLVGNSSSLPAPISVIVTSAGFPDGLVTYKSRLTGTGAQTFYASPDRAMTIFYSSTQPLSARLTCFPDPGQYFDCDLYADELYFGTWRPFASSIRSGGMGPTTDEILVTPAGGVRGLYRWKVISYSGSGTFALTLH